MGSRFLPSGSTQATGANKHRNQWEAALEGESILGWQDCKLKAWQRELVWGTKCVLSSSWLPPRMLADTCSRGSWRHTRTKPDLHCLVLGLPLLCYCPSW